MTVDGIEIDGDKSHVETRLELSPLTVLVGPNGSARSTSRTR